MVYCGLVSGLVNRLFALIGEPVDLRCPYFSHVQEFVFDELVQSVARLFPPYLEIINQVRGSSESLRPDIDQLKQGEISICGFWPRHCLSGLMARQMIIWILNSSEFSNVPALELLGRSYLMDTCDSPKVGI